MLESLPTHNILCKEQNGFRSKLTTENVIFTLTNEILTAIKKQIIGCWNFCDLKKASDYVNHNILLKNYITMELWV
jgi:hypothetical protein